MDHPATPPLGSFPLSLYLSISLLFLSLALSFLGESSSQIDPSLAFDTFPLEEPKSMNEMDS